MKPTRVLQKVEVWSRITLALTRFGQALMSLLETIVMATIDDDM